MLYSDVCFVVFSFCCRNLFVYRVCLEALESFYSVDVVCYSCGLSWDLGYMIRRLAHE